MHNFWVGFEKKAFNLGGFARQALQPFRRAGLSRVGSHMAAGSLAGAGMGAVQGAMSNDPNTSMLGQAAKGALGGAAVGLGTGAVSVGRQLNRMATKAVGKGPAGQQKFLGRMRAAGAGKYGPQPTAPQP